MSARYVPLDTALTIMIYNTFSISKHFESHIQGEEESICCRGVRMQEHRLLRHGGIFTPLISVWNLFLEQRNAIHLECCHPINTLHTLDH